MMQVRPTRALVCCEAMPPVAMNTTSAGFGSDAVKQTMFQTPLLAILGCSPRASAAQSVAPVIGKKERTDLVA